MDNPETLIVEILAAGNAALVGVWYVSSLGELKNAIDRLAERLNAAMQKSISLFDLQPRGRSEAVQALRRTMTNAVSSHYTTTGVVANGTQYSAKGRWVDSI